MTPFEKLDYSLQANEGLSLDVTGGFIRVLSATGAVRIGVDDYTPVEIPVGVGYRVPNGFTRIRIEDASGAVNAIEIAVGVELVTDDRLTASATLTVDVVENGTLAGSTLTAILTTATEVIAALAGRKQLIISADPSNTDNLTVEDSAGNLFGWLQPGQSVTLETSAEVEVTNPSGLTQNIGYAEIS